MGERSRTSEDGMSSKFELVGVDQEKAKILRTQIKELRIWFDGWSAGQLGNCSMPIGHECLWQLMLAIDRGLAESNGDH